MTAPATWTPASRPGLIPLHPLSFGTILGRSFTALRQNPAVLLGFALVVQTLTYVLLLLAVVGVTVASFSRLDTLQEGTDEYDAVMAGSIALIAVTGIVLGLAAGALSVIIQGIVVTEVARASVAERLTLRALWAQVRPVAWRLLGYAFLLALAVLIVIGAVVLALIGIGIAVPALAIVLGVLVLLAAIPLYAWLGTKLSLVPATIILEHATLSEAIARSWRLVRGRFWSTLGILVVIQLGFATISQVVSIPFTVLGTGLGSIIAPTGDGDVSAIVAVFVVLGLTQIVTLLIQSVALVVQATATAIIYIDCRMRHEGLDLDLLAYVEQRDAGVTGPADPYRANVGRVIAPRPAVGSPALGYPPGFGPPLPGYGAHPAAYGPPGTYAALPAYPPAPQPGQSPPYPAAPPQHRPAAPAYPVAPPQPAAAAAPAAAGPDPQDPAVPPPWTAPGVDSATPAAPPPRT